LTQLSGRGFDDIHRNLEVDYQVVNIDYVIAILVSAVADGECSLSYRIEGDIDAKYCSICLGSLPINAKIALESPFYTTLDARPRHGQVGGYDVGLTTPFPDIGHFKYSSPPTNVEHMHNKRGISSQQLGTVCEVYDN